MNRSMHRGHNIELQNDIWIYSDTKEPVSTCKDRRCGKCKNLNIKEGHDACLGTLPGVMNACCGHGIIKDAYVQFLGGFCIRGKVAMIIIEILKKPCPAADWKPDIDKIK